MQPSVARARQIAEQLWPGTAVTLEKLTGGITNLNYKASGPAGTYVIRLFGQHGDLLSIDRANEEAATLMAARLGIGAELVSSAPDQGYLVTRFLPGQPVTSQQMHSRPMVERVAGILRTLHQGPEIPGAIDPFAGIDFYSQGVVARGADLGDDYHWARPITERIRQVAGFAMTAPCHGDLMTANFIDVDGRLHLVDWEYAGMSDPRLELANFAVNHGFTAEEDRDLVRLYYGEDDALAAAAVGVLRFVSAFREGLWAMMQQLISELDFDFRGYGAEQFAKMHAVTENDEFTRAIELLESVHIAAGAGPAGTGRAGTGGRL